MAQVLADALLADGEPWGEFISVMVALERTTEASDFVALRRKRDELLAEHREHWVPGLDEEVLTWRWGMLERATVRSIDELAILLESPLAIALRGLTIETRGPAQAFVNAALDAQLLGLQALSLHIGADGGEFDARGVFARGLRTVSLVAESAEMGRGPWPTVHTLRLQLPGPGTGLWLPKVAAHTAVEVDLRQLSTAPAELCSALSHERWPSLRTVTIEDDDADTLCGAIATWPLIRQLESISIIGPFSTAGVESLLREASRLSRLRHLSLEAGRCESSVRRLVQKRLPQLSFHKVARRPASGW